MFLRFNKKSLSLGTCYFDKIKKEIENNALYRDESYCVLTAKRMVKLLTGEEPKPMDEKTSACCSIEAFFEKNADGTEYIIPFIQDLFDQAHSSAHKVFHFSIYPLHDFIVYKENDGKEVLYRVIQSNLNRYTVGHWLGFSPCDNLTNPNRLQHVRDAFKVFGEGKKGNLIQLMKFIKDSFDHFETHPMQMGIRINEYTIPMALLNSQKEPCDQKEQDEKARSTQPKVNFIVGAITQFFGNGINCFFNCPRRCSKVLRTINHSVASRSPCENTGNI